jgi:hypothetical protein
MPATMRAGDVALAAGGFALGGVMVVFLPPLAMAIALVLGGIVAWSKWRGNDEQQPLTWLAVGFLVAVGAYVALAFAYALG